MKAGEAVFLSVIIPAYNEEKRLGSSLEKIFAYLANQDYSYEVIVVDDGSRDTTSEVVEAFSRKKKEVKLIRNCRNEGKGFAVRRGMLAAQGEYLLFSDADLSTPIEEVEKLFVCLEDGYDIAIGSRGPGARIEKRQPLLRQTMGKIFNILFIRFLVLKGIKDTQCGFKLFKRNTARDVFSRQRCTGFAFDVEILLISKQLGYRIKEQPIRWINSIDSKVNILRDSPAMLGELWQIKRERTTRK